MKTLITECNHCRKPLCAGEIIERWCDDCRKPVQRQARKDGGSSLINAEYVRSILSYDEATGNFQYRTLRGAYHAGAPCGTVTKDGYISIHIYNKTYRAHRLAWLYVYGEWPNGFLDHINLVRTDNRIANLRIATPSQNNANQPLTSRNSSGFKGVTWNKRSGKWQAAIKVSGKSFYLGLFDSPEDAHDAYLKAAKEHYREFARAA